MSFPRASEVRRKAKGAGYIEEYIRDILVTIKDDILAAVERRETQAVTELPTDFDIPTMNATEAQRTIYYYLAKKLEELEYIPTYFQTGKTRETQKWWMRTRWFTENDDAARQYMDQYIKSRTEYTEPDKELDVVSHRRRGREMGKIQSTTIARPVGNKSAMARQRPPRKPQGGGIESSQNRHITSLIGDGNDDLKEIVLFN
jgi:hypothetical protein